MPNTPNMPATEKLAALTSGTIIVDGVIAVSDDTRIAVRPSHIEISRGRSIHGRTFEILPAGLTFAQIAAHALAVASYTATAPLGTIYGDWNAQKAA